MKMIILASASERRKELLAQLIGRDFEVRVSSYAEGTVDGLDPTELVMHHSREKALDVAGGFKEGIIISADTVVICDDKVLGKPEDEEDARTMLSMISGKDIKAVTGLTVLDVASGKLITEHEMTVVRMREMSGKLIDAYVNTGEPMGKAGAFAIQGKGAILVERIEGDFFNVVGLPLFRLSGMLEGFRIDVLHLDGY
ncbi:Maf family nucleotide pyrophosphatase [Methanolobus sp. WCC4]|uniref:Maf family nucleotide pyrophosphatase n=1 Tax=Methanolobus sp. WCC4 TaxID=3125784 RepID=UPI0030F863AC